MAIHVDNFGGKWSFGRYWKWVLKMGWEVQEIYMEQIEHVLTS